MNPELEDSKKIHDHQVINDPAYAAAWKEKRQELDEAWDKARTREERIKEAGSIVQQQHLTEHYGATMLNEQQRRPSAERVVENWYRDYINYNAAQFQQDYKRDPERVLIEMAEKRQAREQAQNKNDTLDLNTTEGRSAYREQVKKDRFRDVGNAMSRPSPSASESHAANQEKSPTQRDEQDNSSTPDLNTTEGRNAYRTRVRKDRFRDVGNAMLRSSPSASEGHAADQEQSPAQRDEQDNSSIPDLNTTEGRNTYRTQVRKDRFRDVGNAMTRPDLSPQDGPYRPR